MSPADRPFTPDGPGDPRRAPRPPQPLDSTQCLENDVLRLRTLEHRVLQKLEDAENFGFGLDEQRMLNVFFDLAQEYDSRRDMLTICVLLPLLFFAQDMRVYLRTGPDAWRLARCLHLPAELPGFEPPNRPAVRGADFFAPIRGRSDTGELLGYQLPGGVLGWIEVVGGAALSSHHQLFFEKYAGRIGFQLHNRLVRARNREHLTFIQNLVADIGHNVIVPNMTFKLFFNRLGNSLNALERMIAEAPDDVPAGFLEGLDFLRARLRAQFVEITRHYEQTSLFLETLLRRRHFEEGRYVLEKRRVNLRTQVVEPQVERYRPRLSDRGVAIDLSMGGLPDQPVHLMADLGLIAQVYANLFSNAVKYTREVIGPDGLPVKFMAYGWEIIEDVFGPGRDGVKLNVFTTGRNVPEEERPGLFSPGYRASSCGHEYGTGQGLAFVRQVVDLHGGKVGYEPQPYGNNFFIVLPIEPETEA